ncbi:hypothetical protein OAT67_03870 [Bacteriovoracaceae bacterium]|nr:hypothetical protein [Bacteriovoracaceae bacterium]
MFFIKVFLIFTTLCLSTHANASWLCRESASQAQGNIFYACGHANAVTLNKAREQSLLNAKTEFNSFCNESSNCKDKAYIITPMRTDCDKVGDLYSCYRGLQYSITSKVKSEIDGHLVKREISNKEKQINKLQDQINDLQYLDKLSKDVNKLKNKSANNEIIQSNIKNGYAGFKIDSIKVPFAYGYEKLIELGPEYEYLIFRDIIGLKFNVSYMTGLKNKDDVSERDLPNSTSKEDHHSHKGIDVNFSLPVHINSVSIAPKFGHTSVKYKSTTKSYNNYGVAQNAHTVPRSFNDNYFGIGVRYGENYFIEIEPRKYIKSGNSNVGVSVGISIGF